jgi:hypothetical protein
MGAVGARAASHRARHSTSSPQAPRPPPRPPLVPTARGVRCMGAPRVGGTGIAAPAVGGYRGWSMEVGIVGPQSKQQSIRASRARSRQAGERAGARTHAAPCGNGTMRRAWSRAPPPRRGRRRIGSASWLWTGSASFAAWDFQGGVTHRLHLFLILRVGHNPLYE